MPLGVLFSGVWVRCLHVSQCQDPAANRFPVLLFFPETKELTLEELDAVFSVPTHKQMARGLKEPGFWIQKGIFRRDVDLAPLVDIQDLRGTREDDHKIGGS